MPFLRVIRDKRGYETTYLMDWYRDGARQRSRVLYVFRTPGGVRVGRDSLDPAVLREIEARYPDVVFDWKSVLGNRQVIDSAPEIRRPRRKKRAEAEPESATPSVAEAAPPAVPAGEAKPEGQAPRVPIPGGLQGATPDEQIAFLNHWYPIIRERIPLRTSDPARREALLALAERLSPAAWTDADQIAVGLQRAAEALDRLSHVFSRRRRRSRRGSGRPAGAVPPAVPPVPGA